ncbi:5098_t:CDS:2, partial [Acaulospora morrowiae]
YDPRRLMLVLEHASDGSLQQYLKENSRNMNWNAKLNLARQIAGALKFLHKNNILHGSLNSRNILIHGGIIKISDFGRSKRLKNFLSTLRGSIRYTDTRHLEI